MWFESNFEILLLAVSQICWKWRKKMTKSRSNCIRRCTYVRVQGYRTYQSTNCSPGGYGFLERLSQSHGLPPSSFTFSPRFTTHNTVSDTDTYPSERYTLQVWMPFGKSGTFRACDGVIMFFLCFVPFYQGL